MDTTKYSITNTAHEKKGVGQAEQNPVVLVDESSTEETDDESSKFENTVQNIEGTWGQWEERKLWNRLENWIYCPRISNIFFVNL